MSKNDWSGMSKMDWVAAALISGVLCLAVYGMIQDQVTNLAQMRVAEAREDTRNTLENVFTVSGACLVLEGTPLASQEALTSAVDGRQVAAVQKLSKYEFKVVFADQSGAVESAFGDTFKSVDIRDMRKAAGCRKTTGAPA